MSDVLSPRMPRRPASVRFGQNLRQARLAAGQTQQTASELADVAIETISRLERGHQAVVSLDLAERLAKAVKVPLVDLLGSAPLKPTEPAIRPALGRILGLLEPLDDQALEDVYQGLRRLLGVRSRPRRG